MRPWKKNLEEVYVFVYVFESSTFFAVFSKTAGQISKVQMSVDVSSLTITSKDELIKTNGSY